MPDAERDEDLAARQGQGLAHGRHQSSAPPRGQSLVVVDVVAQDGELVAAETGQGVARPHDAAQPVGHGAQDLVADVVAEAVVDELEAVEVEEHHGHVVSAPRRPAQGHLEAVHEELAVGQAGERVVDGGVGQPFAQRPALGDVLDLPDQVERPVLLVLRRTRR